MTKRFSRHEPEVSAGQSLESRLKKASPLRARSRSHPRRARARSNAHETRSIDAEDSTPPARTSTPARLVRGAESQMIPRSTRSAPAPDADDVAVAAFDRSTRAIERRDAARAMERREKTRPRSVRSRASRTARAPRSSATTSPVHRRVRRARSGRVGVPRGRDSRTRGTYYDAYRPMCIPLSHAHRRARSTRRPRLGRRCAARVA